MYFLSICQRNRIVHPFFSVNLRDQKNLKTIEIGNQRPDQGDGLVETPVPRQPHKLRLRTGTSDDESLHKTLPETTLTL